MHHVLRFTLHALKVKRNAQDVIVVGGVPLTST